MRCLSCNGERVIRKEDTFTCEDCSYTFSVQDAKANLHWLKVRNIPVPLSQQELDEERESLMSMGDAAAVLMAETVKELREISEELGLTVPRKVRKTELVRFLIESGKISVVDDPSGPELILDVD